MSWIREVLEDYVNAGLTLREAVEKFALDYGINLSPIWSDIEMYLELNDLDAIANTIENYFYENLERTELMTKELAEKLATIYAKYRYKKPVKELLDHILRDLERKKVELKMLEKQIKKLSPEEIKRMLELVKEIKELETKAKVLRRILSV